MMTSAVHTSIQAVSPLLGVGAGLASSFFTSAAAGLSGAAAGLSCARVAPAKASDNATARNAQSLFIAFSLERRRIGLAGADADDLLEIEDENLAVADLAGVGRLLDRLDRL